MKNLVKVGLFLAVNLWTAMTVSHAASGRGSFGINVGAGIPFLSQAGINYFFSDRFSLNLGYNNLSLTADTTSVSLTMPELLLNWHPFSGSFYLGVGAGQETLTAKGTDTTLGETAEIKIEAMTTLGRLGWMWGAGDGGFWFGIDMTMVSPSGAKTTITSTLPTTNQTYIDAVEQGDKFGSTSYTNLTFFRLGYLF